MSDQPIDQPIDPAIPPVEPTGAQSPQCLRHYVLTEQPVSARDRIGVCTLLAGHDGPHGQAS